MGKDRRHGRARGWGELCQELSRGCAKLLGAADSAQGAETSSATPSSHGFPSALLSLPSPSSPCKFFVFLFPDNSIPRVLSLKLPPKHSPPLGGLCTFSTSFQVKQSQSDRRGGYLELSTGELSLQAQPSAPRLIALAGQHSRAMGPAAHLAAAAGQGRAGQSRPLGWHSSPQPL